MAAVSTAYAESDVRLDEAALLMILPASEFLLDDAMDGGSESETGEDVGAVGAEHESLTLSARWFAPRVSTSSRAPSLRRVADERLLLSSVGSMLPRPLLLRLDAELVVDGVADVDCADADRDLEGGDGFCGAGSWFLRGG